jgi:hypothetical protein
MPDRRHLAACVEPRQGAHGGEVGAARRRPEAGHGAVVERALLGPREQAARDVGGDRAHRGRAEQEHPEGEPREVAGSGRLHPGERVDQRERAHALRGRQRQAQRHAGAERQAEDVSRAFAEPDEQPGHVSRHALHRQRASGQRRAAVARQVYGNDPVARLEDGVLLRPVRRRRAEPV